MERVENQKSIEFNKPDSSGLVFGFINKLSHPLTLTWEHAVMLFFSITAIITRFTGLGERVMSHDESLHVFYSWQLSIGNGFVHSPMMHGPFLFEATAILNFLFGANDFTSRLIPALMGTVIAVVIPQLLKPWIGRIGALFASLLLLISPYMLFYSRYIRHDTLVILWMLFAVFAMLAYLKDRKERNLVMFVVALALMFSTMEVTFIYLAIFVSFLVVRILWNHGLHWKAITSAPEFDLIILMTTLGAFFSSPILLPVLNPIFVRLTGIPFVDLGVLGSLGTEWANGSSGVRLWAMLGVFSLIATVIGFAWGRFRWLKLAGLFLTINILLFTSFLTNLSGVASGFIGSLGYWLSQQGVARGGQPWYYFLIVFPLYEYLPMIGGICAGIYYMVKHKSLSELAHIMIPLLSWWAVSIFVALSLAGEKMPWLSTHITVPFILLTAWWIGQILEGNWKEYADYQRKDKWLSRISLLGMGILLLLTARTSFFVNYVNYDYSTEFIDYAHGAPGVKWVMNNIEEIANHTAAGKELKIAFDDEVSWPMSWYLKDYPNRVFFGSQLTVETVDAPVVIAGPKNWNKVELLLGSNYHRFEVIRLWWPIEDYKNLSWQRIWNAVRSSDMRAALWDILWKRDYARYASLKNEGINLPAEWPLAEKMRVYVRKDIAIQMLSLSMGTTMLPDLPPQVDAFAEIQREVVPDQVIQPGDLNAPRNIAIGKDGNIYMADTGNSRIVKYNSEGKLLTSWGSTTPDGQDPPPPGTFNEPWGIAVDADGNIFVADTWNYRIQKFDPDGKFLLQWGVAGVSEEGLDRLWGPRGVAAAPDGKVYVTDTGNKRVVAFSVDGNALFQFETAGDARLDEPVGVAVSPSGNVYIADTWNSRIAIFSPEGKFFSSFPVVGWNYGMPGNEPYLAIDQDGNVLVSDPENFRILEFTSEGKPLAAFRLYGKQDSSFGIPNGVAIGADNSIWISDSGNNQLVQFSKSMP